MTGRGNTSCMFNHSGRRLRPYLLLLLGLCGDYSTGCAQENDPDPMMQLLQRMVEEDPGRSDSWRLIGRIHRKNDRLPEARDSFLEALRTQPDNVAAHFDLGDLLEEAGEFAEASQHFDQVMSLAPHSSYADKLVDRGIRQAPPGEPPLNDMDSADWDQEAGTNTDVTPVGFEVQTFDGADDLSRRLLQLEAEAPIVPNRTRAYVELGTMYNTNVSLTPISRELTGGESASAQLFLSPDVEWIALRRESWRAGTLGRGYFSFNESNFQSLNLSSFQPGVFAERDFEIGSNQIIGRLDYVYSIDFLDSESFGNRHAVTASVTTILPQSDVIYGYVTTSMSDFANDGINPNVDSLDGVSVTTGISRFFQTDLRLLPRWSLGLDLEHADTTGADFRYNAVTLHGDATVRVLEKVSFIPTAGIGYREYGDFTGPVNRDELTGRIGAKLKWQVREKLSISTVVGYDRFASDNDQFDTQRTQAGLVFTFVH